MSRKLCRKCCIWNRCFWNGCFRFYSLCHWYCTLEYHIHVMWQVNFFWRKSISGFQLSENFIFADYHWIHSACNSEQMPYCTFTTEKHYIPVYLIFRNTAECWQITRRTVSITHKIYFGTTAGTQQNRTYIPVFFYKIFLFLYFKRQFSPEIFITAFVVYTCTYKFFQITAPVSMRTY